MSTVSVAYVGLKESETDCFFGTGLTWEGKGSVHEVPIEAWKKMANHPDVWELVESETSSMGLSDAMDDEALRAFAAEHAIKVHHKQHGDTLRAVIVKALAVQS